MVVLFSNRKSKAEKEIVDILTACGADFISDKTVCAKGGYFTLTVFYKPTDLKIEKGIVLILDNTEKFLPQSLPDGTIGICEDCNSNALKIFEKNNIPVISCGNSSKNTITISSINDRNIIVTLQREITDKFGNIIYPGDYKIALSKDYSPFAVLSSAAILLLNGITPNKF